MRRLAPVAAALAVIGVLFTLARLPHASHRETAAAAARFHFRRLPIAEPPGLPEHTIRTVNPMYEKIRAWISSVGAGVAINDLTGSGRPDDMCLVDTRSDSVIVTPVPGTRAVGTYRPFTLTPSPALPYDPTTMAPMGCVPGDFGQDGRMGLLVYYWGRSPVIFMPRPGARTLSAAAYRPVEVVPGARGAYRGPLWNTNAVAVADFDGDGHPDLFVGNYFPDSPVLDSSAAASVVMQEGMSHANNAGGDHILRWNGRNASGAPKYTDIHGALPKGAGNGWTLAAAAADIDGSMLPDVYVANDFGHDHLFVNTSTRGHIRLSAANGQRSPVVPKSKSLGADSFKGMGVQFTDLNGTGTFNIIVSNIATRFGLQESNFVWTNTAGSRARMRRDLLRGVADYSDRSMPMGLAQSGWSWDVKAGDFTNAGRQDVVQTTGFVKGTVNRWPQLQELAMTNDNLLSDPVYWPNVQAGDDIAGHQCLAFYTPGPGGRYVNVSSQAGLCVRTPTRGIAVADTRGDGALDFAVARQWGPPAFYQNDSPNLGDHLDLRLYLPTPGRRGPLRAVGTPAIGAVARVTTASGRTQVAQVDGGSGHSGKNDFGLHFGLGHETAPVRAAISWRDLSGGVHHQTLTLTPGSHSLLLGQTAKDVSTS